MGYDWSDNEADGLRKGLTAAFPRFELLVEHLDTKKFPAKKHFPLLADLLEAKYTGHHLDAIISMDNAALEFALKYRQRISPGTPLIFCGINDFEPAMIVGQSGVTGVAEYHDFAGTLELALRLHPAVRDVVVIHDFTDTGLAIRNELQKSAPLFPAIRLHFMEEMPLEETVLKLKAITPDHLVLMLSYTVEKGGRTFTHSEAARLVSSASPVPVYSVYLEQLGAGVVGGRMMAGQIQGQKAAELAVKIIAGESPERLPVITDHLSDPMFDYRVLKKFAISPTGLPKDAVVINKPPVTLAISKKAFWIAGLFTGSTTVGLILLALNIRKRKRLEELLHLKIDQYQESQEELLATEEMLRAQVDEYVLSQDELHATEEMLRAQIDEYQRTHEQLIATEEMLRLQLEAVESSSQKFKAVFENSPITVALTSLPDGTFSEVNQAFIDMFGYSREEALGKTTLELGVWRHDADRIRYLQLLSDHGHVHNFEVDMCRKGGGLFTVLFSGVCLDIVGTPSVLSAVMDITEQKRLQAQLQQAQKMDVIGQLAGGIAHDFNNMLAGIMAAGELLQRRLAGDAKNLKLAVTIVDAATRSAELTRDLLTFSRKGRITSNPVHLNETIAAVVALLERTIDKQIQIRTRLGAHDPIILGDATQMQNALLNLGVNARDAMPQGGTLTISTSEVVLQGSVSQPSDASLAAGTYLQITVSDTGIGMTPQVMEHIFEPFFSTKETGKGTGLGLATVYGTVRNLEGKITVQSEPGLGSNFTLYLPLAVGTSNVQLKRAEVLVGSGGILLVDDEEILRDVGRYILEDLGYTVYLAENGEAALEVYALHRAEISLVMLDMIMPKMGGKETCQRLHQLDPGIKVLFCSGFHREGTEAELRELGGSGFIQKPYSHSDLSCAVADALAMRGTFSRRGE
jgi:PAS domain S-box-containing protein